MTEYYLLHITQTGTEGFLRGNPIHTDGRGLSDAKMALAWQVKGGFNPDHYMICVASDIAGIMTPKDDPKKPVLLMQGCLTLDAYKRMVTRIWGDEA